jgi:hypothetical protein
MIPANERGDMRPSLGATNDREAALGRFAVAVLCADGPDAGDRLASIVAQAVGLGLVRSNTRASEATDPWALPAGKAVRP